MQQSPQEYEEDIEAQMQDEMAQYGFEYELTAIDSGEHVLVRLSPGDNTLEVDFVMKALLKAS